MNKPQHKHIERIRKELGKARLVLFGCAAIFTSITLVLSTYTLAWICVLIEHVFHPIVLLKLLLSVIFMCSFACLSVLLVRRIHEFVKLANVARYIENQANFKQQLLTVAEYIARKGDYPYSVALVEKIAENVNQTRIVSLLKYTKPVQKLVTLFVFAFCLFAMITVTCMRFDLFMKSSSWLVWPEEKNMAQYEWIVPQKQLTVEPNQPVKLFAFARGKPPRIVFAVLQKKQMAATQAEITMKQQLRTSSIEYDKVLFEYKHVFLEKGMYECMFIADGITSPSIKITVKNITAQVYPSYRLEGSEYRETGGRVKQSFALDESQSAMRKEYLQKLYRLEDAVRNSRKSDYKPDLKQIAKELKALDTEIQSLRGRLQYSEQKLIDEQLEMIDVRKDMIRSQLDMLAKNIKGMPSSGAQESQKGSTQPETIETARSYLDNMKHDPNSQNISEWLSNAQRLASNAWMQLDATVDPCDVDTAQNSELLIKAAALSNLLDEAAEANCAPEQLESLLRQADELKSLLRKRNLLHDNLQVGEAEGSLETDNFVPADLNQTNANPVFKKFNKAITKEDILAAAKALKIASNSAQKNSNLSVRDRKGDVRFIPVEQAFFEKVTQLSSEIEK